MKSVSLRRTVYSCIHVYVCIYIELIHCCDNNIFIFHTILSKHYCYYALSCATHEKYERKKTETPTTMEPCDEIGLRCMQIYFTCKQA